MFPVVWICRKAAPGAAPLCLRDRTNARCFLKDFYRIDYSFARSPLERGVATWRSLPQEKRELCAWHFYSHCTPPECGNRGVRFLSTCRSAGAGSRDLEIAPTSVGWWGKEIKFSRKNLISAVSADSLVRTLQYATHRPAPVRDVLKIAELDHQFVVAFLQTGGDVN